ncbi:nucleotide pyrophosphohydrolase [bacterium]|nr:MAG: nucleotide pyrophosphohydrolase [bacterium]
MYELMKQIREFVRERDWEQFHTPKNLAMALSIEIAEIMEHFQWKTAGESRQLDKETWHEVKDEIGDTFVYLLRLCDELGIDLLQAANDKMLKNAEKYPVGKAKGNAKKYTEFDE